MMPRHSSRTYQLGAAILLPFFALSPSLAAPVVYVNPDAEGASFSTSKKHLGAAICVTGPDGFVMEKRAESLLELSLHEDLADGIYSYEVTFDSMVKRDRKDGEDSSMRSSKASDSIASGAFRVVNGVVLNPNIKE